MQMQGTCNGCNREIKDDEPEFQGHGLLMHGRMHMHASIQKVHESWPDTDDRTYICHMKLNKSAASYT